MELMSMPSLQSVMSGRQLFHLSILSWFTLMQSSQLGTEDTELYKLWQLESICCNSKVPFAWIGVDRIKVSLLIYINWVWRRSGWSKKCQFLPGLHAVWVLANRGLAINFSLLKMFTFKIALISTVLGTMNACNYAEVSISFVASLKMYLFSLTSPLISLPCQSDWPLWLDLVLICLDLAHLPSADALDIIIVTL